MAPSGRSSLNVAAASAAMMTLAAAIVKINGLILGLMIPSSPSTTHRVRPPSTGGQKMVSLLYHMTLAMHLMMSPYSGAPLK